MRRKRKTPGAENFKSWSYFFECCLAYLRIYTRFFAASHSDAADAAHIFFYKLHLQAQTYTEPVGSKRVGGSVQPRRVVQLLYNEAVE
jgi:hypothetical protein